MEILSQLINSVDQNPDSILVMRQQTEQRLPAHQHNKAQLLLVYGGIAYLQTDAKDFYIPSNHYIWIPKNYPHNLMFNTQDLYIINIYFPDEKADSFIMNWVFILLVSFWQKCSPLARNGKGLF